MTCFEAFDYLHVRALSSGHFLSSGLRGVGGASCIMTRELKHSAATCSPVAGTQNVSGSLSAYVYSNTAISLFLDGIKVFCLAGEIFCWSRWSWISNSPVTLITRKSLRTVLYISQSILRLIQFFNVDDFIQPRSHLAEQRLYILHGPKSWRDWCRSTLSRHAHQRPSTIQPSSSWLTTTLLSNKYFDQRHFYQITNSLQFCMDNSHVYVTCTMYM